MTRITSLQKDGGTPSAADIWTESLLSFVSWSQGKAPLKTALENLARYFGAEVVCLSRFERGNDRSRIVQVVDLASGMGWPELAKSYVPPLSRSTLDFVKPGAALLMSDLHPQPHNTDAAFAEWQRKRGVRDIGLMCLGTKANTRDFLELHFCRSLTKYSDSNTNKCAKILSEVFRGRRDGLVDQMILKNVAGLQLKRRHSGDGAIMGQDNPAGLTRAEWRLCVLIANGLSRDRAAASLGITNNTIRSHLRNVYSKTGYETFHELALHLASPCEQQCLIPMSVFRAA